MGSMARKPMGVAEFLAWEERQEGRFEFDGRRPVEMPDVTVAHSAITLHVRSALHDRLRGTRWHAYGPDVKIIVAGSVRYPDAFVSCARFDPRATVVDDPVAVFEVISHSDAIGRTDRIEKLREYFATPSIQRYVILEQTFAAASLFVRREGAWTVFPLISDEVIALPEIGIELPVSELYADIAFEEPAPAG